MLEVIAKNGYYKLIKKSSTSKQQFVGMIEDNRVVSNYLFLLQV